MFVTHINISLAFETSILSAPLHTQTSAEKGSAQHLTKFAIQSGLPEEVEGNVSFLTVHLSRIIRASLPVIKFRSYFICDRRQPLFSLCRYKALSILISTKN